MLQPIVQETNDASIKEFLNIIVEEVDRLNKIVTQFLDYARPYRGDPRAAGRQRRRSQDAGR